VTSVTWRPVVELGDTWGEDILDFQVSLTICAGSFILRTGCELFDACCNVFVRRAVVDYVAVGWKNSASRSDPRRTR